MAAVAIGNELLSGKVRDANVTYLAAALREIGAPLVLSLFVPDEEAAIVDALHYACARADVVLTTGGIGPTHDDITLSAVARAFGRDLHRDPGLEAAIRSHYGEQTNEDLLSMAEVPEGAELIQPAPFFLPVFRVERVYVFPGDPLALQRLFEPWKEFLRQEPFHLVRVELDADEGLVAPLLRAAQDAEPELEMGSYPRYDDGAPYRVLITIEGKVAARVNAAAAGLIDTFRSTLGEASLLRVDPPVPR